MTQEEKAKAYDEALERARKIHDQILNNELIGFPDQIREIFPQLRESEDEKIIDTLIWLVEGRKKSRTTAYGDVKIDDILAWLEKQKEPKPINHNFTTFHRDVVYCAMCDKNLDEGLRCNLEIVYKIIKDIVDRTPVVEEQRPTSFYEPYNPDDYEVVTEGNATRLKKKEQKPVDLSEMMVHKEPYIAPVPTPIVADEQKPEWSKEDELKLGAIITDIETRSNLTETVKIKYVSFLKSLRPSWKPSTEQMKALTNFIVGDEYDAHALAHLWAELKELSE